MQPIEIQALEVLSESSMYIKTDGQRKSLEMMSINCTINIKLKRDWMKKTQEGNYD